MDLLILIVASLRLYKCKQLKQNGGSNWHSYFGGIIFVKFVTFHLYLKLMVCVFKVRICTKTQYPPLLESQFKTLLGDNYYNHHHFYFELDHAQTRALISLFKSLAPANFNQVAAVSSKKNLAVSSPPTKVKLPGVPEPKKVTNSKETNPFSVLSSRAAPFIWADDVDSASNTDEKTSEELVSDCDDLDDNLQDQCVPHSNPDELSQNSQDKTVEQGVELVECNHPDANPMNGERVTIDESMLLNSVSGHNGVVDNSPGGVGLQPERETILEKLKELSSLRQQLAMSSQGCADSSPDQCVPDETQINANLSCDPFDATMEYKTSSDECPGNAEVTINPFVSLLLFSVFNFVS